MSLLRWALGLATLFCSLAQAASPNALLSCYNTLKLDPAPPETELFVLIDQTTPLDPGLQQMVATHLANFLKPGQAFSVFQFSAFTQGKYAQAVTAATLDAPLPNSARNALNKTLLTQFDACVKSQTRAAAQLAIQALQVTFNGTSSSIGKSDILTSLKDISSAVRHSAASRRVVLLVSDMLENSSITSFYANNAVRKIDPSREMLLVHSARALGDFSGAQVHVMGAGLLAGPRQAQGYRDPKTMNALTDFWTDWFQQSKAELIQFGTPALLNPVR